jgi:hypothetical protein
VCELATVNRDGTPATRPVCALWEAGRNRFVLATPVAFPQKAFNVRRDPRAALLFSDFSGCSLGAGAAAVLVQGTASAPDEVTGVEALADWWRFVYRVAPHQARTAADPSARAGIEFYYWRLPIYFTPERYMTGQPRATERPSHATERPSPAPEAAPVTATVWDLVTAALAEFATAVLTANDGDGRLFALRCGMEADQASQTLRFSASQPLRPGAASVLWHRHNGALEDLRSLLVAGQLDGHGRDWTFQPGRVLTPWTWRQGRSSSQLSRFASLRERSLDYMARRGIPPPHVDWDKLMQYAAEAREPLLEPQRSSP